MNLLWPIRPLTLLLGARRSSTWRPVWLFIVLSFLVSPSTWAVDPEQYVSQYAHTAWRIQDGFFKANPTAIVQTQDGYLWIGTRSGLLRFDGVRVTPWNPEQGERLPSSEIVRLLAATDGSLWIGTRAGLSHWKNHKLTNYPVRLGIGSILEDKKGNIWFTKIFSAKGSGRLCRVLDKEPRCYGEADGVPTFQTAVALAEDRQGNLWIGGDTTLLRWKPNSHTVYLPRGLKTNDGADGIVGLASAQDGTLWIGISKPGSGLGLEKLVQGSWNSFNTPDLNGNDLTVAALYLDREGALWVGTFNRGIYRIFGNEVNHFDRTNGLSSDLIWSFFEDREGNLWVATSQGMDRFSDTPVVTFSSNQGICSTEVDSVLASHDGSVWAGGTGALSNLRNRSVSCLRSRHGLPGDQVTSMLEDHAHRLWVGIDNTLSVYQNGRFREIKRPDGTPIGLVSGIDEDVENNIWIAVIGPPRTVMRLQGLQVADEYPEPKLPATRRIAADPTGGIWLGLVNGDLAHYHNGKLATDHFVHNDEALLYQLLANSDGSVLAATSQGLIGWKDEKVLSLRPRQGLPCDAVNAMTFDDQGNLWLFMDCALGKLTRTDLQNLWSNSGINPSIKTYDPSNGVRTGTAPFVAAARSQDGRLWFANGELLQMIDPAHLKSNSAVPPVQIEQIVADQKTYSATSAVRLPPKIRSLELDYTALSFVAQEKVRFRYKLEGHDADWQDPGTRRQAYYTDLAPREYRFRVIAANNDGVWNETGASLEFSIAPAYYQTNWFRALCVAAFLGLLWMLHQFRIWELKQREKKLRQAIGTMPTFAWSALPDGSVDFVNRHWQEYTGLSAEQTVGSGWESAAHPEDLEQYREAWRACLANGKPFESEVRYRRAADGQYRWFLTRAVPLRNAKGNVVKWYGTATDIEDRKRAEQLQAELAHIDRVTTMSQLTASLAHEIKQPIGSAVTNAEACLRLLNRNQPDLPDAREAALEMTKDARRAADIIERLRSLYQKGSAQLVLVDVNEVIAEMVTMLRNEATRHSVTMRTDLAEGLPGVMADRVQMQQVLMNLMLNGIEAMKDTNGELIIKSQFGEDSEVLISVTDNGIGLPAERVDEIFNPFFTTKPQGTGLGLAITRSIVESHRGRVWAIANSGRGTTFHFTLPVRTAVSA